MTDTPDAGPLRRLLADARGRRVFSGAAWSVGTADGVVDSGWLGTRRWEGPAWGGSALDGPAWGGPAWDGPALDGQDVWDLASVTKPVVGLAVMALVERGALQLTDTVSDHLPDYRGRPSAGLSVAHLLAHTSGLPGGVPLYRGAPTRADLLAALRALEPVAAPGAQVAYSSQGFILLGLVAEAAGGAGLDELVRAHVTAPAGMTDTGFTPGPTARARAVATEQCAWRGRLVCGEVHDENAAVLGGVAGHAGLFGTLADLQRLGRLLAGGGAGLLEPETLANMTACHSEGLPLRRGLAWEGHDGADSPVGPAPGPDSYGHTGFTGTSLWIDPATRRYYVLLTNRVHPTRDNPAISEVRSAFHTAATELLPRT